MSTLERIQKLEESMGQVVARVTQPDQMLQMAMNKIVGIEQSVASLGKTLTAVTEELAETETLNSMNVMIRLRRSEDESSRSNVESLLSQDIIEVSDVVSDDSLVALEQKIINMDSGESTVLAEYNLIGMASPVTSVVWKDSLLGKSVGDTVKGTNEGAEDELLTVIAIYSVKEKEVIGDSTKQENQQSVSEV